MQTPMIDHEEASSKRHRYPEKEEASDSSLSAVPSNSNREYLQNTLISFDSSPSINIGNYEENIPEHPMVICKGEPSELYDRKCEQALLFQAFDRRMSYVSTNELILISGKSGTGKTALARKTLFQAANERGGYFIMGKFDRMKIPQPYSAFVHAFTDFVNLLSQRDDEVFHAAKKSVMEAVDPEGLLLFDMIPALGPLLDIDGKSATHYVKGVISQSQLKTVFCKFVRAICSPKEPLVLCIDDLQWADPASLGLFQSLAIMENCQGLVLVATCRDNEVSESNPVAEMLCSLEDNVKSHITNIELSSLSECAVNGIIRDMLSLCPNHTLSDLLTETVYKHTAGNGIFVVEYLKSLEGQGVLCKDDAGQWRWNQLSVSPSEYYDDAVDFFVSKIESQSEAVQVVIATASCLGGDFDEYLLHDLLSDIDVPRALMVATRQGLLLQDGCNSCFTFVHDQIQQAAYLLVPEEERDKFHLNIGRKLMDSLSDNDGIETNIFLLADQFTRGIYLIEDQDEKDEVADIFLQAAQQASAASDFTTSSAYLDLGLCLLSKNPWRDEYFLSLSLHNASAELAYCLGDWKKMEKMTEAVLTNAGSLSDTIVAHATRIISYGAQNKLNDGIHTALNVLKSLGQPFPSKVWKITVMKEYIKTRLLLRGLTDDDIMCLPSMTEESKLAAMSILNVASPCIFLSVSPYLPLVTFRMVQLTLKHGLCAVSSWAFASLGLVLIGLDKTDDACRYGELALKLVRRFDRKEWYPRVNFIVNGCIFHFKKSSRVCLQPLKDCIRCGLEIGDIEISMNAAYYYCTFIWNRIPLGKAEAEFSNYSDLMRSYKQNVWVDFTSLTLQLVDNFMGKTSDPLILTGDRINQDFMLGLARRSKNINLEISLFFYRLILAYAFNNYDLAFEMAQKCQMYKSTGVYRKCVLYYYEGLIVLALARRNTKKKKKYIKIARVCIKNLEHFARSNPANNLDKLLLVQAEFAFLMGHREEAISKYHEAIAIAESEGFLLERAIACERTALAMHHFGQDALAESHFDKSVQYYSEWGACAKVKQMRDRNQTRKFDFC